MTKPRLIALGDLWADICECGERAYYGESTLEGSEACLQAVKTGKVFCDAHIPQHLYVDSNSSFAALMVGNKQ